MLEPACGATKRQRGLRHGRPRVSVGTQGGQRRVASTSASGGGGGGSGGAAWPDLLHKLPRALSGAGKPAASATAERAELRTDGGVPTPAGRIDALLLAATALLLAEPLGCEVRRARCAADAASAAAALDAARALEVAGLPRLPDILRAARRI